MGTKVATALMLTFLTHGFAAQWHLSLYLGNDSYWRQRAPILVRNQMDREANGAPVAVRVGTRAGEIGMVGAQAEAVRVCSADGVEMLYELTGPGGEPVRKGPVPQGSTLTIPAECPPQGEATYYVYWDNPAAWAVPDFLEAVAGVRNGGLEEGEGDTPYGWRHDPNDPDHQTFWVTESPRSGRRCLKTVVAPGAQATWIATRQSGIHILGGARYIMRAWVKAQDVQGYAGWYIHVGNEQNFMIISPMLSGGGGTYDWKEVVAEFTAPKEANRSDLGTVLWGTGTAWFDDVSLECLDPAKLTAEVGEVEQLEIAEEGADAPWMESPPNREPPVRLQYRLPLRLANLSAQALPATLVIADLSGPMARLSGRADPASVVVAGDNGLVPSYQLGDLLLFEGQAPARTIRTYYAYFAAADAKNGQATTAAGVTQTGIPSLPKDTESVPRTTAPAPYQALVDSPRNLVQNASFEGEGPLPHGWTGGAEGQRPAGTEMGVVEGGLFGSRCVRMYIPHSSHLAWTGWRQDVPVEPGKRYLFAAWVKCEDVRNGSVQLHAHFRKANGELCQTQQYTGAGPAINGTTDWTLMSGIFTMPEDVAFFQLHLTMLATGTVWHDGVVLVEVAQSVPGRPEAWVRQEQGTLAVWPVNPIVKVFQDDLPPQATRAVAVSAARNEREPIQLAVRGPEPLAGVQVQVDPPRAADGATLPPPEVGVVGYVPIDHKTNYYTTTSPPWHRKYPTAPGACDGWPGMWPDPILPRSRFDLQANQTQPVWVTVGVPKDAAPGDYRGAVRLVHDGNVVAETPFTVHVWDFALPDEMHVAAVYDLRLDSRWNIPGKSQEEIQRDFLRFMAQRRVCPDTIRPEPRIEYRNGQVVADFTEFDRAAEFYLDELKLPHFYTPWYFYLFGWGHPPGEKWGEKPYEGEPPYEGVDRSALRPEYKRAYQACLKAYWDHLKERGWHRKCLLYISDEPFYDREPIREQMKALCDMIHEVDPEIPIYCSTWSYNPEWVDHLDVWGIGHYGIVSPERMQQLRESGERLWFTTDGQMCTDTPYCAVERLLPHYCFHYGVEAYEFWGISWLTYDPYKFGWHSYIYQSDTPGKSYYVRYPNGDGFLAYPGAPVGHDGPVTSVRLEQAREGCEDYEYLHLLRQVAAQARAAGRDVDEADRALAAAANLVSIPNAGGRYSTRILPNPDAVFVVREAVAKAVERLAR